MNLKHAQYRAKFKLAPYIPLRFPVHVDIELAGKCQLACTMCPYGTGDFDKSKQGMMSYEMAEAAMMQASDNGAKSVKFNFRGEPGLCVYLAELIGVATQHCNFVEKIINTNLTAFLPRRLTELCQAGLDLIIISIDGATKETYEKIRVKGDWDKLMFNLIHLNNILDRPKIRLQMVVQEDNKHEVELFKKIFTCLSDEIVFQSVRERGAGEGTTGERTRCPQPWQRLIVAWDGMVFACCGNWNNEYSLGQFPALSLQECWDSAPLVNLRRNATKFDCFPCEECTVGSSYK